MQTIIVLYLIIGAFFALAIGLKLYESDNRNITYNDKRIYGFKAFLVAFLMCIFYIGLFWPVFLVKDVIFAD